jgi:hypothetical protein
MSPRRKHDHPFTNLPTSACTRKLVCVAESGCTERFTACAQSSKGLKLSDSSETLRRWGVDSSADENEACVYLPSLTGLTQYLPNALTSTMPATSGHGLCLLSTMYQTDGRSQIRQGWSSVVVVKARACPAHVGRNSVHHNPPLRPRATPRLTNQEDSGLRPQKHNRFFERAGLAFRMRCVRFPVPGRR